MYIPEFKNYLKAQDYSDAYAYKISVFVSYCQLQSIKIDALSIEQFTSFVLYLKDKSYDKGYIASLLKAVRFYYKFLIERYQVNPKILEFIRQIKLPRPQKKIKDILTFDEVKSLVGRAMTTMERYEPIKVKSLIYFMYFSGARLNEVSLLRRELIDLDNRRALVRFPKKSKKEKILVFTKQVSELLVAYFSIEPQEFNAFNMTINEIKYFFRKIKPLAPYNKKITPHTFRHSFGHMLQSKAMPIHSGKELFGHSSVETTGIYWHEDFYNAEQLYRQFVDDGSMDISSDASPPPVLISFPIS